MPDFVIVTMQKCSSIDGPLEMKYGNYVLSNMFSERHWPRCTCPAYKYSKASINFGGRMVKPECKHILSAQDEVCGWHQQWCQETQTEKGVCPRCGGPTVSCYVAT
jgi:hypothetical protein